MISFDDLSEREGMALIYLYERGEPSTISQRRGGGSTMRPLRGKGLVKEVGQKSGQRVWILTDEALSMMKDYYQVCGDVC